MNGGGRGVKSNKTGRGNNLKSNEGKREIKGGGRLENRKNNIAV